MDLYAWTTVVSAAFYEPLQGLEIALRNALHGPVARCYGAAWYDNPAVGLDLGSLERVAQGEAGDRARRPGVAAVAGGGEALVRLLGVVGRRRRADRPGRRQGVLRDDALASGVASRVSSPRGKHGLNALRKLRNRIAHHEPIFARQLVGDHGRILEVTGWISPVARMWVGRRSRVPVWLAASN